MGGSAQLWQIAQSPGSRLLLRDAFAYLSVNPLSLCLYGGGLGAESLLAMSLQCLQNIWKNNFCLRRVVIPQWFCEAFFSLTMRKQRSLSPGKGQMCKSMDVMRKVIILHQSLGNKDVWLSQATWSLGKFFYRSKYQPKAVLKREYISTAMLL